MLQFVDNLLRPRLQRLDLSRHIPKLIPNHGLVNQLLSERLTLLCLSHRILHSRSAPAKCLEHDPQSLMIKIHHRLAEPRTFGADEVLGGHFYVFERYESS